MNSSSSPNASDNRFPPLSNRLELPDANGDSSLHVDMEAFFEFSFWIAEELEDLVAEHKHQAARRRTGDLRKSLVSHKTDRRQIKNLE